MNSVYCLVSCSWASEVCTADKPSWKHACICRVCHLEYNAKHCSAWVFLVSLFGKLLCKRTKKWKEDEHWLKTVLSHVCWYICECIVNIAMACSIYDIRIVAKNIALDRYTGVSLQAYQRSDTDELSWNWQDKILWEENMSELPCNLSSKKWYKKGTEK